MRILTYLLVIILILIGVSFAALNAEPVTVNFYIGIAKLPLSVLVILTLIFGVFLGLLTSLGFYIKLKSKHVRLKQRLKFAEKEISNLRSIPLKDEH